jgi:DNA polymerase-3 subunit alpha
VRERLSLEKSAIGFYLSGHLFDEHAAEVRRLVPTPLVDQGDTRRESVLLAGIVNDLRVISGARGRTCIFKLDDGSAAEIELGDDGRIWPSDDALARWRAVAEQGRAIVMYE